MKSYKFFFIVLLILNNATMAQWYQQNSGTTTDLYSVFFIDENTGWACGDSGKIIKTTNGGQDWLEQNSNTTLWLKGIQFVDANNGWAYGYNQILNTTDGGTTWNVQDFPPPAYIVALQYINLNTGWIMYHNSDSSYIAKTTNGGNTWEVQNQAQNEYYEAIYFLDENYGWASFIGGVLKTTNGGMNWIQYTAYLAGSPMCIKFVDPNTGWISSNTLGSYDISKSTDSGLNWFSQISGPGEFIQSISCLNANTVYAAGIQPFVDDGFIWKTTDGGASWFEQYRDNGELYSIFFVNDTMGWSVGRGGKILFTENGGVTSVKENSPNPVEFTLSQNYPNPFNPSTKIKFTIPQSPLLGGDGRGGLVTLKVYDVLGNEVATLVNEEKPAGEYEVEFSATGGNAYNLSSGIYFYQLVIRGSEINSEQAFIQTKKMILMK